MKITGATSLLELQRLIISQNLDVHVNYVGSAHCFRCVVVGPSKDAPVEPFSATGIGRDLGEAVADAFTKFEEER